MSGVPELPAGFVECNGQMVNDEESPLYGEYLPDLNGDARFLRGGATSGTFQSDQNQSHRHQLDLQESNVAAGSDRSRLKEYGSSPFSYSSYSGGDESRPINMSVVWIIKIKESGPSYKILDIGDWDLTGDQGVVVVHNLDSSEIAKILDATLAIRNDAGTEWRLARCKSVPVLGDYTTELYVAKVDETYVHIATPTTDLWNTDWNSTAYNRGFVTLWMKP